MNALNPALSLAFCRISIFGFLSWKCFNTDFTLLADYPGEWFAPLGLLGRLPENFISSLLTIESLQTMKWLTLGLAIPILLGVKFYRLWALAFSVLYFVLYSLTSGFNAYVGHSDCALLFCSWLMVFAPATHAMAIHRNTRPTPEIHFHGALMAMSTLLLWGYTLLGLRRLAHAGMEIYTGDAVIINFAIRSFIPSFSEYTFGAILMTSSALAVLAKASFFLVTVLEVLSPLCLVSRWFRFIWVPTMIVFHVGTLLGMNIFFSGNVLLIVFLMTPVDRVFEKIRAILSSTRDRLATT